MLNTLCRSPVFLWWTILPADIWGPCYLQTFLVFPLSPPLCLAPGSAGPPLLLSASHALLLVPGTTAPLDSVFLYMTTTLLCITSR